MMGKFKEYFERAKSSGLDETIKVPVFESKKELLDWLNEVAADVELDAVIARDDVYDPITEELLVESGGYLSDLKAAIGEGPFEEAAFDTEVSAKGGWSPLMKKYMSKTSVSPEQRRREKAGDKAMWEGERKKTESVADKYLKRLKEIEGREKFEKAMDRYRARQERELKAEFKGMTLKSVTRQFRRTGEDLAGDLMYDLENDIKNGRKTVDEAKDHFDSIAQSAATEIYIEPQVKRYLSKVHEIEDPSGWAADEVYMGMEKAFEKRSKNWK